MNPIKEMQSIATAAGHPVARWQIDAATRLLESGMVNPADLFAAVTRRLVDGRTGELVKIGDVLTSFRGDRYTVTGWPHDGRNRIWVKAVDAPHTAEFFPSVFELVWQD